MYQIDVCLVVNTEYALGPVKAFYNHTLSKLVPRHERTNVLELNLYPKQRKSGSVEKELGVANNKKTENILNHWQSPTETRLAGKQGIKYHQSWEAWQLLNASRLMYQN